MQLHNHCCHGNKNAFPLYCSHTCHCQYNTHWQHCHGSATMHSTSCCTMSLLTTWNTHLHVKCAIFLTHFNQIWISEQCFIKVPQHQISWKSVQLELCWYMWMDIHTNKTKLTGALCDYTNALKKFWVELTHMMALSLFIWECLWLYYQQWLAAATGLRL